MCFEERAQFSEILDDGVGPGLAKLREAIITSQDGTGVGAAMFGGIDVVLHVADEERLGGIESVFRKEFVDFFSFVPDLDVRSLEVVVPVQGFDLDGVVIAVNGAEQERSNPVGCAELEEWFGVRERLDAMLHLLKFPVEPLFELGQGDIRGMLFVESCEGEAEGGAELVERHRWFIEFFEDMIGGLPHGGKVIDQCSGPVEDDISDHGAGMS